MNFVLQGVGLGVGLVLVALIMLALIKLRAFYLDHKADAVAWISIIVILAVLYAAPAIFKGY